MATSQNLDKQILVQTLAVQFCNFFQTLATCCGFYTLFSLRRLFIALIALDIGNDSVLLAALGETFEGSFEWFVWFYDYADHDGPLVLFYRQTLVNPYFPVKRSEAIL